MSKQNVALHIHEDNKLVYAGVYNVGTAKNSSSMSVNYSRARYLHEQMYKPDSDLRGLKSGFMISLINTNFNGWETILFTEELSKVEAVELKKKKIQEYIDDGYTFIGAKIGHMKGDRSGFDVPTAWKVKWNISNMTKQKIFDKIDFIVQSLSNEEIPQSIYNDAYFCVIIPDRMSKRHNFEAFEINDLASLYKYVRLYTGLDQPK